MDTARNIYRNDVDFGALALRDAEFSKYLKQNNQLDFSNPEAVQQLTKSLLSRDFGLKISLPDDRLCPPVPNRLNYILWLQDLIDTTGEDYTAGCDPDREVIGLDIGTGSSCIYPLLGCSQRPLWKFVATDIDDKNLHYAEENVEKNNLQLRIRVIQTTQDDQLIPLGGKIPLKSLDFTMCNPPFYESLDEMMNAAMAKQRPAFSACTGSRAEMITSGGEAAFVTRMIDESLQLRDSVQWYTTMLGKLSSISVLIEKLLCMGNQNWAVTEFVQGSRTRRWAIAWSWRDLRPLMGVARSQISSIPKHLLPFPSEFTFQPPPQTSVSSTSQIIDEELRSLHIPWHWDAGKASGLGFAMENVWSRAARRKRRLQQDRAAAARNQEEEEEQGSEEFERGKAALGFRVLVRQIGVDVDQLEVVISWVKGVDSVLFESFCGMVKRKVEGR
ncbi:hypothetical protein AJ80_02037 [Polytolypa hystricis UAMH7299]|uniref:U6 small nuclear RNA (adenine-(43)-N(6))-methyltransferase n=1 Tax=Polytolypa hystricis (strain UAMH7299) TaxID=1447883 RepID=A0A2B7YRN3_POLH7|nr:hypothetical protein AJ80_02037 [Polytolypa hystricis UAMH7299]